jgi:hypothetical protein
MFPHVALPSQTKVGTFHSIKTIVFIMPSGDNLSRFTWQPNFLDFLDVYNNNNNNNNIAFCPKQVGVG